LVKLVPERLRGVFTTRHYTDTRLPLPLPKYAPHAVRRVKDRAKTNRKTY